MTKKVPIEPMDSYVDLKSPWIPRLISELNLRHGDQPKVLEVFAGSGALATHLNQTGFLSVYATDDHSWIDKDHPNYTDEEWETLFSHWKKSGVVEEEDAVAAVASWVDLNDPDGIHTILMSWPPIGLKPFEALEVLFEFLDDEGREETPNVSLVFIGELSKCACSRFRKLFHYPHECLYYDSKLMVTIHDFDKNFLETFNWISQGRV